MEDKKLDGLSRKTKITTVIMVPLTIVFVMVTAALSDNPKANASPISRQVYAWGIVVGTFILPLLAGFLFAWRSKTHQVHSFVRGAFWTSFGFAIVALSKLSRFC